MSATGAPYIRCEVRTAQGEAQLAAYAKGVERMKSRPAQQRDSWTYQAAMHGTRATPPPPPPPPLWNGCKHLSWFFVVWHRMYVYYFEQIIRTAVVETGGPATWALPYWNYGLDAAHASIPPAFREPTVNGQPNPLYVQQRAPGINQGAALNPQITSPNRALARPNFIGAVEFGGGEAPPGPQFWREPGVLEQTPHNDVHGAVGGNGGWMNDPFRAAQDPIFWLHHTNIDRIWALWNKQGHADPTGAPWTTQSFSFFDIKGDPVSKADSQVLDTVKDLSYIYDKLELDPPQVHPFRAPVPPSLTPGGPTERMSASPPQNPEIVGASEHPVRLVGGAEQVAVPIDARAQRDALASLARTEPEHVLLHLEDIEAERNPGSVYGLYVNLPEGADEQQQAAHHAGNLSFFGIEHTQEPPGDEHPHGLRISLDITDLAEHLKQAGEWDDGRLDLTLLPIGLSPPPGAVGATAALADVRHEDVPVTVGRVSVSYA
jgi:tyrosinase